MDRSYSVSDTQVCIEYIIKKHETLTAIRPIHVYINRINNRLRLKYKIELQSLETTELFGSTKKLIDKTRKEEKVQSLEVVEVVQI